MKGISVRPLCLLAAFFLSAIPLQSHSAEQAFKAITLAEGFEDPTSMAVLPDGSVLVTEQRGGVYHLNFNGSPSGKLAITFDGLVLNRGLDGYSGGLLDVAADPDYILNHMVYFSYNRGDNVSRRITIMRAQLDGNMVSNSALIFECTPASSDEIYGKMAFAADKTLLFSTTWGSQRYSAIYTDAGKIVRINRDGTIPATNPFVNSNDPKVRPEIYALELHVDGGMALNPESGAVWVASLGKLIREVRPYIFNDGAALAPDDSPMLLMPNAIGLSGTNFYNGSLFPAWKGSMIIGGGHNPVSFRVVDFRNGLPASYRDYSDKTLRALCDIKTAPDGSLLALSCNYRSSLLRIVPQP